MNESLLRSHIESIGLKRDRGQAIGVHSKSRWQGKSQFLAGQEQWRVFQCDSVLEMRQHLIENSPSPLLLITALPTAVIGDDVRARLFKQQLTIVDPWSSLAERFKARQVEPALRQSSVIADAALDALGSSEPFAAPSGILTAEIVWEKILDHRLGIKNKPKPDLMDFLPWIASETSDSRWTSLGSELQSALEPWLQRSVGDLAPVLIRSLLDGNGGDAIAIGIVLGALGNNRDDSRTMGRLERFTGQQPLSPSLAQSWKDAAERWATHKCVLDDRDAVRRELGRADQLLESLGAAGSAIESRWSPLGFQQRLASFAESLAGDDPAKCQAAYALVSAHEGSRYLEELRSRRENAEMAMRLSRWLMRPVSAPSALDQAVLAYEQDGSWVDLARHQLLSGDESEGVSRSYRKLFEKVTARRETENRRFAELLSTMTASNQVFPGLLLVEDVLAKVVAPLAKHVAAGILLIVMDGMSLPIWHELSLDLLQHGWPEWVPEEGAGFRSILTALPSATSFSRASLLCGRLIAGAQNVEKRGFQDNVDLRAAGRPGTPPVLFHKDEVGTSGSDLAESVRLEIRDPHRKVVGVIVNVVDDHLEGPQQLSIQWSLRSIPVLHALLGEARDAGRAVVLASDHGHVLDHGSKLSRKTDSADRWRTFHGETPIEADELVVKGSRVLVDGGQIVCPTSENVRYTANLRLGYHGGLTAQECVAPLAVVAPALMDIGGWRVEKVQTPEWWSDVDTAAPPAERPKPRKTPTTKGKEPRTAALPLFQTSPDNVDWVDALLASEVFAEQMTTFANRLKREQVEQSLRALADRNMVLLKSVFAQRIGISALRVEGLIASLQRILNVEGYPVLSVDASQTIRLNIQLLREQFGLGENSGG
jgi:hypothetical protein